MELAYNEITKKDEAGNYVYSSDIVTDIEAKYAAMKIVAAELTKVIGDVVEAYKEVNDKVVGYYPEYDFLAEKKEEEIIETEVVTFAPEAEAPAELEAPDVLDETVTED